MHNQIPLLLCFLVLILPACGRAVPVIIPEPATSTPGETPLPWGASTTLSYLDNLIRHDEVLYTGSSSDTLYAFDVLTGVELWQGAILQRPFRPILRHKN